LRVIQNVNIHSVGIVHSFSILQQFVLKDQINNQYWPLHRSCAAARTSCHSSM